MAMKYEEQLAHLLAYRPLTQYGVGVSASIDGESWHQPLNGGGGGVVNSVISWHQLAYQRNGVNDGNVSYVCG